jgi:hypothetical protein
MRSVQRNTEFIPVASDRSLWRRSCSISSTWSDPDCPDWLDVLLDLTEQTSLPTSGQLGAVATQMARVSPRVQFHNCAVIASEDALFGMGRVFGVLSESYFAATHVFRTVEEGVRWLDSRLAPPPGAA